MNYNESREKRETREVAEGKRKLKSQVEYRPADFDAEQRCSECCYYVLPGQPQSDCEKVVGQVQSYGVCDLWEQNPNPPSKSDPDRDGDRDQDAPNKNSKELVLSIIINNNPGR